MIEEVLKSVEEEEIVKSVEEESVEESQLVFDDEDEIMELKIESIEDKDKDKDEDEEDDDDELEEMKLPTVISWINPANGKTVDGVEVKMMKHEIPGKYSRRPDDVEACQICFQLWTDQGNHQMSCLPCGHIFGMSCIEAWLKNYSHGRCIQCNTLFALKDVRILYINRLCIPAHDEKTSSRRFPYSKEGYTAFKQYQRGRLTYALNQRADALKQRANVLVRQKDAMEWRTNVLNRKAYAEKRAKALEQRADALGRVDALRRADALRCRADALGRRADEYLQKADAFGRQAKALRQRAKALCRWVDAYNASVMFYKQSYKELHGIASSLL